MARLIKRYDNRKLYDTEASEYVSLGDVAELVRGGETVRIIDNVTGRDLTAQTLTQVILEEGKSGTNAIPSDILHQLLRRSEEALDVGFEQLRTTVDDLVQSSFGRLHRLVQGPRADELEELRGQLQALEQQLATLLGDLRDEEAGRSSPAAPDAPPVAEAIPAAPDTDDSGSTSPSGSASHSNAEPAPPADGTRSSSS
jgi:polyhydroxyalkanoate synthesis repressor PhaR